MHKLLLAFSVLFLLVSFVPSRVYAACAGSVVLDKYNCVQVGGALGTCEWQYSGSQQTYSCSQSTCQTVNPACSSNDSSASCYRGSLFGACITDTSLCSHGNCYIADSTPTPAPTSTPVPTSPPGCSAGSCDTSNCSSTQCGSPCGWNNCSTCSSGTRDCPSGGGSGKVQGIKTMMPGNTGADPANGQIVSVTGASSAYLNPYYIDASAGGHTASVTVPNGGYGVGYTVCSTAVDPQCGAAYDPGNYHNQNPTPGASLGITVTADKIVDLWWHFYNPPTGSIAGPTTVCANQANNYTLTGAATDYQNSIINYSPTSSQNWANPGPYSGGPGVVPITFPAAGTYYLVTNAYGSHGGKCTGNPFPGVPADWGDCGPNDRLTVTVNSAPTAPAFAPTVATDPGGVSISWAGGGSYYIQRATTSSGPWSNITGGPYSSPRIDSSTTCGNSYYYRLVSSNSCGTSAGGPASGAVLGGCVQTWFQASGGNVSAGTSIDNTNIYASTYMCTNAPGATNNMTAGRVSAGSGLSTPPKGTNFISQNSNLSYDSQSRSADILTDNSYAKLLTKANTYLGADLPAAPAFAATTLASITGNANVRTKAGGDGFYYLLANGPVTFGGVLPLDVGTNKVVVFVNGDAAIRNNINVSAGGNFVLVTSGSITVGDSALYDVGSASYTPGTPNLHGLFFAGTNFITSGISTTKYLSVKGSVVALQSIIMTNRKPLVLVPNPPAHYFEYDPQLLISPYYPQGLTNTARSLEEQNP